MSVVSDFLCFLQNKTTPEHLSPKSERNAYLYRLLFLGPGQVRDLSSSRLTLHSPSSFIHIDDPTMSRLTYLSRLSWCGFGLGFGPLVLGGAEGVI